MPTNRLYDSESIADNPYQLPVDAPQFDTQPREPVAREPLRFTIHPDNMTPGPPSSSTGEDGGAGYKLTPVDYDPWAESQTHKADTKRAPLSDMQEMARKGATAVAGMPYALLKNLIVDPIKGAANLTNRALGGEFVGNTAEDVGMAMGAASLGGSGGLLSGPMEGAVLGSGPIKAAAAEAAKAPTFYSAVEHAVENVKQNKASGEQWLATISNSRGVKPEELDWTGLRDFLAEKAAEKKTVTKAEVQDYINANKVELKEINKGVEGRDENGFLGTGGDTKYSKYQLPGAEPNSYRETLLTLPTNARSNFQKLIDKSKELVNEYGEALPGKENELKLINRDIAKYQQENPSNLEKGADVYKSSHWDEPNILAHVRMNDRMIEGKKSLHLEEIQSDWHQTGKKYGYGDLDTNKWKAEPIEGQQGKWNIFDEKGNSIGNYVKAETAEDAKEWVKRNEFSDNLVSDAPFKKTWHELALKRMIREAAEKGHDRLSWTPGEAQAARYDLSKQVEAIRASKNSDGTYHLMYQPKGDKNFAILGDRIPEKELSNNVGKELAEKITKDNFIQKELAAKEFSGLDLKVGGEGMKGFYDKMIPQALEKLGKEHGVKVKTAELPSKSEYTLLDPDYKPKDAQDGFWIYRNGKKTDNWFNSKEKALEFIKEKSKPPPVHYIDIPKSLKDQAMHKGFPLFSGGIMFSPVQGNPFQKDNK